MANRRVGIFALGIAALALVASYGLFQKHLTRPGEAAAQSPPDTESTPVAHAVQSETGIRRPAASIPDALPSAGVFHLVITDLKPGVEIPVLKALQGDPITLVITSSETGTLEVHGYDQRVAIAPGVDATLVFMAERAGRFPIHLHDSGGKHLEVTALEITPR